MARSFNDATDRIDYTATWNPSGAAFTFSGWVYRTQGAEHGYILHRGINDANYGFLISHLGTEGAGTFQFFGVGTTNYYRFSDDTATPIPANTWAHILATFTGDPTDMANNCHLYLNGSEVTYAGTQNGAAPSAYLATSWSIGGRNYDDTRNFGGYLAGMAIWNRVVSAGERAALAAGYSPQLFLANIKGYWPLVRDTLDRINGDYGTLDGTAVVTHVPTLHYAVAPFVSAPSEIMAILGERGIMRGVGRGIGRGL